MAASTTSFPTLREYQSTPTKQFPEIKLVSRGMMAKMLMKIALFVASWNFAREQKITIQKRYRFSFAPFIGCCNILGANSEPVQNFVRDLLQSFGSFIFKTDCDRFSLIFRHIGDLQFEFVALKPTSRIEFSEEDFSSSANGYSLDEIVISGTIPEKNMSGSSVATEMIAGMIEDRFGSICQTYEQIFGTYQSAMKNLIKDCDEKCEGLVLESAK